MIHSTTANENLGDSANASDRCTNGCTCDRCLMQLAIELRDRLNAEQRRKVVTWLASDTELSRNPMVREVGVQESTTTQLG
jgi:hypothetical protein